MLAVSSHVMQLL